MKLIIDQSPEYGEVEITIKCGMLDERLQRLVEQIRTYSFSIAGRKDGRTYNLLPDGIYYFESVEGRTFAYTEKDVYECGASLSQMENNLAATHFVRVSKSCILNASVLESVRVLINGRMEARLSNGEKLIINRHYVQELKDRLNMLGGE